MISTPVLACLRTATLFGVEACPVHVEVDVSFGLPHFTMVGLPDASGWDLIPQARELRPGLRVGVVTGWEGHNAPSEGADFLLRKPIRTSDFLNQVADDT